MKEFITRENLEARIPTWQFFLLCVVTFGFYSYYWILQLAHKMRAKRPETARSTTLIIIFALTTFSYYLFQSACSDYVSLLEGQEEIYSDEALGGLLAYAFFWIIVMFFLCFMCFPLVVITMKNNLQKFFTEAEKPVHMSSLLTFFFPVLYLYYCIYNQDERFARQNPQGFQATVENTHNIPPVTPAPLQSPTDALEALLIARETGKISEQVFQAEKEKILAQQRELAN